MQNGLLLDVDGVLNNYSTDRYGPFTNASIQQLKDSVRSGKRAPDETWWDHTFELELPNLQALRVIIKKYSIKKLVICSTWRHVFTLNHFRLLLISKGYPDIADLIHASTDICTKEDREKFKMTRRERTIEVANYLLSLPNSYEGDWYVLDDDVSEDDMSSIKQIQHVKSLYFEFKHILQEYRRKEQALIEELATGEVVIHPLEKSKEDDSEIMKEIKGRYQIIKSAILDPKLKIKDMFNTVARELKRIEIAAMFIVKEKENGEVSKKQNNKSAK